MILAPISESTLATMLPTRWRRGSVVITPEDAGGGEAGAPLDLEQGGTLDLEQGGTLDLETP